MSRYFLIKCFTCGKEIRINAENTLVSPMCWKCKKVMGTYIVDDEKAAYRCDMAGVLEGLRNEQI